MVLGARTRRAVLRGPLYVQVGPSDRCNYRCPMCWDHGARPVSGRCAPAEEGGRAPDGLLPLATYRQLVRDLARMGVTRVKLTGRGEPLLHPDCVEMVRLARGCGLGCGLTTNGSLLTAERARGLVDAGLDAVEVSLNASSPETHRSLHPGAGAQDYDRILEGVRRIAELSGESGPGRKVRGPWTVLSFALLRPNLADVPGLARVAREAGFREVALRRTSLLEGLDPLRIGPDALPSLERDLRRLGTELEREGIRHNTEEILQWGPSLSFRDRPEEERQVLCRTPCYVGWFFTQVLASGEVYPCCQCYRSMGNVRERRFPEIWRGDRYRAFRQEASCRGAAPGGGSGCYCGECGFVRHNVTLDRIVRWPRGGGPRPGPASWRLRDLLGLRKGARRRRARSGSGGRG